MAGYENRNRGDKEGEQLRKLFIGGLTPNVTDEDLKHHFSQWGELTDVVVMKDKVSGRSRGFGFITYRDESSVDDAQANRPHVLDNKEADTKRAMPRGESARDESHVRVEKLFIGGLKPDTTEDEIRDYFSSYGEVVGAEIAKMRETGKPRGFAFVSFKDYDPVDKAILYKPHNIGGSERVDCKKALSKEQMAELKARQAAAPYGGRGGFAGGRGGGGYGGGGGGGYSAGGYGGGGGYGASAGGYGGGYGSDAYGNGSYAGGYADGGYGGGYGDSAGYGGGGYAGGAGYSEGGEGSYGNGAGFGSYDSQGYSGGPAKSMGGFGGGPQRFQPYSGGRGRGGGGGGFRGGRGGY